ncbi:MAG: cytidylate kinase-like family protein [Deltaproteobacteria bacterium]|nr:cytidylate kinase-like family protein [Deltaproteobacteria bacterium]
MDNPDLSFDKFIQELVDKWGNMPNADRNCDASRITVVTVSSEPGSGGQVIASGIAERMGYDLFQRDIIREIAERADIGVSVIESIEKERLSGIEDFIATLVSRRYLWPEMYLEQLMKVVSVIGKHGMAVIAGRGANFILPPNERLSIRVVAPLDLRVLNISRVLTISEEEARKRVIMKEAKRKAFIRKSFNADIADPINYDLTFNTEFIRYEAAVEAVQQILEGGGKSG